MSIALGLPSGGTSPTIGKEMTAQQNSALAGVVTIDKEAMHGAPCFAHTRVPVQTLIDFAWSVAHHPGANRTGGLFRSQAWPLDSIR